MHKKQKDTLTKILLVFFALVFLLSLFMLGRELIGRKANENQIRVLSQQSLLDTTAPTSPQIPEDPLPTESGTAAIHRRDMAALAAENEDCAAWVKIPGTAIDYPVMFTPLEPQKYLRRDFYGDYSTGGTPFLDEDGGLDCDNVIVYGHHMQTGEMFSDLLKYEDPSFWREHPKIEFETAEGWVQYSIFAVAQVQEDDDWYLFHQAEDSDAFSSDLDGLLSQALYDTGIVPVYGQQILTLSTCYHYWTSDQRFLVAAVRMDAAK